MTNQIIRRDNRIMVVGDLTDYHWLLAKIFNAIERRGYEDVVLDFSHCTNAFQNSMLSVCAQIIAYRGAGVDFRPRSVVR